MKAGRSTPNAQGGGGGTMIAPPRIAAVRKLIEKSVSATYDVSIEDFHDRSRDRRVVWPRQLAMYLMREISRLTFAAIGNHFGVTTWAVQYNVSAVRDFMEVYPDVRRDVVNLRYQIALAAEQSNL